jgi:hypothetical protein
MKLLGDMLLLHFSKALKQFYSFLLVLVILLPNLSNLLPKPAAEVLEAMKLFIFDYSGATFLAYAKKEPLESFLLEWESLDIDRGLNDEEHVLSLFLAIRIVLSCPYAGYFFPLAKSL